MVSVCPFKVSALKHIAAINSKNPQLHSAISFSMRGFPDVAQEDGQVTIADILQMGSTEQLDTHVPWC